MWMVFFVCLFAFLNHDQVAWHHYLGILVHTQLAKYFALEFSDMAWNSLIPSQL